MLSPFLIFAASPRSSRAVEKGYFASYDQYVGYADKRKQLTDLLNLSALESLMEARRARLSMVWCTVKIMSVSSHAIRAKGLRIKLILQELRPSLPGKRGVL